MKERVSIKDIARICNVSISTVSKALNDRADVGNKKKEEIRRTARELNYIPNYMASALKSKKTMNIGVLLSEKTGTGLMHEYFAKILNSFKSTVEERGYVITLMNASSSPNRLSYIEQCRYMNFDGVFVLCADFEQEEVRNLAAAELPLVSIDHVLPGYISILSNQYGDMTRLLKLIYERGHRKIAYIHGQNNEVTRGRLEAYRNFMKEHGLPFRKEYLFTCPYRDTEKAAALTRIVISLPERPTCILYPDDLAAAAGVNVMQEMGMCVPREMSAAGYDGIQMANIVRPRLTTLRQDTVSMGIQAGNRLINRIEFPDAQAGAETVLVDGMVEPGESVAIINAR